MIGALCLVPKGPIHNPFFQLVVAIVVWAQDVAQLLFIRSLDDLCICTRIDEPSNVFIIFVLGSHPAPTPIFVLGVIKQFLHTGRVITRIVVLLVIVVPLIIRKADIGEMRRLRFRLHTLPASNSEMDKHGDCDTVESGDCVTTQ